jgi:predicted Rossmann fold flavoprotein
MPDRHNRNAEIHRSSFIITDLTIIIIGGGAAGFFGAIAAAEAWPAAERGPARIIILEKNRTVLNKVRISGGGRCNVTHACFDHAQLVRHYPRGQDWLKPLLTQFDPTDTVQWFARRGVALTTEADGRMFPVSNSSETIVRCLTEAARRLNIDVRTSCGVARLQPNPAGGWQIDTLTGETLTADRVLVATGGYPQPDSYGWLPTQAEPLQRPVPSLFTVNTPGCSLLGLAGVSVADAGVSVAGSGPSGRPGLGQRGPLLITHQGFSGPAVLRLSAWAARELAEVQYRFSLRINWLADRTDARARAVVQDFRQQHGKKMVASQNPFGLPARLWESLATDAGIAPGQRWADLPAKPANRLIDKLINTTVDVTGKNTFKDEFVTCGGIALGALDPRTLESRAWPGLFFAGEVLDVDGITGGFNFQNAWTTGYVAGQHLSR